MDYYKIFGVSYIFSLFEPLMIDPFLSFIGKFRTHFLRRFSIPCSGMLAKTGGRTVPLAVSSLRNKLSLERRIPAYSQLFICLFINGKVYIL